MSQQPPEDFQLSADDPMLEQVQAATRRDSEAQDAADAADTADAAESAEAAGDPVGAEAGMGEPNTFEPEEVTDDSEE